MATELQKPDAAPETTPVIPLTPEEQTMAAMTSINVNLAALLESQQKVEKLVAKQTKDITSIKTVAVFFLILTLVSLIPVISLTIRSCALR